jgi:signal transduction histidine kinase/CheY-like chemotaxis protein
MQAHAQEKCEPSGFGRNLLTGLLTLTLALLIGGAVVRAESGTLQAAPRGVVETGVPSFVVLGAESLGLSTAPSDLHLLPDGRILVVSQREIAIGDGVRWETFQQAADQNDFIYAQVAVDDDGRIYAGTKGAICRIDLGEDARWRLVPVISVPGNDPYAHLVQFPDSWLWYSGSGAVVSWRPGQQLRTSGLSAAVEHIFAVGSARFASNGSSGALYQLHFGGDATLISPASALATDAVTCSADDGENEIIVGTVGDGLRSFDGRSLGEVTVPRVLGSGSHISTICKAGAGLYAAAVDSTGIVFFERGGRIVQVLNRTLDHRLARVRRLVYSQSGVLWALLDNAVACVQFPAPISNFDPLLASVMNYARPLRHKGELWVLADGHLARGAYTPDGYLDHFDLDNPPGRFLWAAAETEGRLFATSDEGIFIRGRADWQQVAPGIINARVGIGPSSAAGRFFFVARNEIGWIEESAGRYSVRRIPVKDLGEVYNALDDSTGAVWLELGINRVGRIEFGAGEPTIRFFGKDDGLGDGWVGIFSLDGIVRFSTSLHLQRFDVPTQRFVADQELSRRVPGLDYSTGRPARDASGRLWFACQGAVRFVDDQKSDKNVTVGSLPLSFEPTEFNMESGGVIWMQGRGHLIRFDPSMPRPPVEPVRAQITSVQLATSDRRFFNPGPVLPPLRFDDNSLVVRFAAAASPLGPPISFEVMLEGSTDRWMSAGTAGSVSFNRLKEGRYVFHVRPVLNGTPGKVALLTFAVQPPWYRTKLAWVTYIALTVGLVLFGVWFISYLERREMNRLGRLIAQRTSALATSEERYRRLNAELEARVSERTTELSKSNADLKREIAERQQAEERARHLAVFPELNPNPVFEFTADGTLAYSNPAAKFLAVAAGVAELSSLLPSGTPQIVADCLSQGTPRLRLETQNGSRTISWSFYPIESQGTVHCYAGDITERLHLEDRYRQAQKMEAIGQLAGGVAHDFNNLLTVIQGHCELLLSGGDAANGEMTESAKEIKAAATRAANLTRQLLTFSRRQPMLMRILDLNEVVSSVGRMLQRLIGEDIVLHTRLLPGGAWVEGDSGMIEQVLLNLAVNARDAMPAGGGLWLELDEETLDEAAARRHPAARPGVFVCMSLRDTGRGISADHLAHIFEPFFTTKDVGKGTGLGLATVHGIVEQHRGWVEVESPPGKGATFRVHLPRLDQGATPPGRATDAARVRGGNESILVVEDEPAVRALAVKILAAQGYRINAAPTGAEALELWRQHAGAFDLLLTDLVMPGGVSGAQLAGQLKIEKPGLRVIYMSGYSAGMSTGSVGANFLQKPFDPALLIKTIRTCLDS